MEGAEILCTVNMSFAIQMFSAALNVFGVSHGSQNMER